MPSKIPLSIFIIAHNEEDRILAVIKAAKAIKFDELIIVDSGSTDKTCEIAENEGAKVIYNKWKGYGPQKKFAESLCKNDWILNIDADEEISPDLASEINKLFLSNASSFNNLLESAEGFKIKIVNKFRFEIKPKKLSYFYNQIRLYNKKKISFKNSPVHDSVAFKNKENIHQLKNIIYHQSFRSFSHWIEKINSYSSMQAEDRFKRNKNFNKLSAIYIMPLAFLKAFILRRYFIYGVDGVKYSILFAFSRFARIIKTQELFKSKK